MRTIVIADVHGIKSWKNIIDKEQYNVVVFLGDYVSTHKNVTEEEQISNLINILEFKEQNKDRVVLLRGNHDIQHLGYYWAGCSGHFALVEKMMSSKEFSNRFLNDTQWIYIQDNIIFSHAGISKTWLSRANCSIEKINDLQPSELFGFCAGDDNPFDCYGDSKYQSPIWIRPQSLAGDNIDGYIQVVGHTPVRQISNMHDIHENYPEIWLCDTGLEQYLVIEDERFEVKKTPVDE